MQAICATEANLSEIHWKTGQNGKEKGYFRRSSCDHWGYDQALQGAAKERRQDFQHKQESGWFCKSFSLNSAKNSFCNGKRIEKANSWQEREMWGEKKFGLFWRSSVEENYTQTLQSTCTTFSVENNWNQTTASPQGKVVTRHNWVHVGARSTEMWTPSAVATPKALWLEPNRIDICWRKYIEKM